MTAKLTWSESRDQFEQPWPQPITLRILTRSHLTVRELLTVRWFYWLLRVEATYFS